MKKSLLFLFLLLSISLFSQDWKNNFEEAQKEAKEINKSLLLVFSGSDWCAPCIKLDKNVWQSTEFKEIANENYILYKADFPKKKGNQLSDDLKKRNGVLADKYNPNGNFPLVVLLDSEGKLQGVLGFKNVSAIEYIELLKGLEKK